MNPSQPLHCTQLTAPYCTVPYCTVLYCTVRYSAHRTVLYCNTSGTSSLSDLITMPLYQAVLYIMARFIRIPSLVPSWKLGASHGDEIIYLFQLTPIAEMIPSKDDQKVSREIVEMWTEFARSGQPGGSWRSAEEGSDYDYFVIDKLSGLRTLDSLRRFENWRH